MIKRQGVYHVRAKIGEYVSQWRTIQTNMIVPARIVTAPSANHSVYSGSPIALLTEGTAEHGTILYALGTNDTTAPNDDAYAESIPTVTNIGKYYTWYKATGDEMHVASEPVCVVTKIVLTADELEPEDEAEIVTEASRSWLWEFYSQIQS